MFDMSYYGPEPTKSHLSASASCFLLILFNPKGAVLDHAREQ